jgi:hypothetical protein
MHINYNFSYTESEEKRGSDLMFPFIPFKNFVLLYSRVGAGAAGTEPPERRRIEIFARSRNRSRIKMLQLRNTGEQKLLRYTLGRPLISGQ